VQPRIRQAHGLAAALQGWTNNNSRGPLADFLRVGRVAGSYSPLSGERWDPKAPHQSVGRLTVSAAITILLHAVRASALAA
jgi:hypothetical protein